MIYCNRMTNFEEILHEHGLRHTSSRQQVFDSLLEARKPLSTKDIILECPSVNRVTIYRVISQLTDIGVVKAVHVGWKIRYELTDLFNAHHHHFQCVKCHTIYPIKDDGLELFIKTMSQKYGFTATAHQFEIEGICDRCNRKEKYEQSRLTPTEHNNS